VVYRKVLAKNFPERIDLTPFSLVLNVTSGFYEKCFINYGRREDSIDPGIISRLLGLIEEKKLRLLPCVTRSRLSKSMGLLLIWRDPVSGPDRRSGALAVFVSPSTTTASGSARRYLPSRSGERQHTFLLSEGVGLRLGAAVASVRPCRRLLPFAYGRDQPPATVQCGLYFPPR
jgi:hypothetical protein